MAVQLTLSGKTARRVLEHIAVGCVVVLVVIGLAMLVRGGGGERLALKDAAKSNRWQQVTIVGGSIYFGHLSYDGGLYHLRSTYFIRQKPKDAGKGAAGFEIVPIGEQLPGPESDMWIRASQVATVQNLKPSSAVVKAIDRLRAKG